MAFLQIETTLAVPGDGHRSATMKILTDLLNQMRYRQGRTFNASQLTDEFTHIEIVENALRSDGVLHWRVIRSSGWTGEESICDIETGTPKELKARITELTNEHN